VEELDSGTIIRVTLSRPKARNALSWNAMLEFGALFRKINSHPTVRVVLVEGNGPVFTSGLDLKAAGELFGKAGG
jgi:enoyl-CoA hydratase